MKGTGLLYHVSEEKCKALKDAFSSLGIVLRKVEEEELGEKVGYLAGLEGYEKMEEKGTFACTENPEVLVMCEFSQMQFDFLMQLFAHKKIPPVELKAVMTPINRDWSFARLISDLKLEHFLAMKKKMHGKKIPHKNEKYEKNA